MNERVQRLRPSGRPWISPAVRRSSALAAAIAVTVAVPASSQTGGADFAPSRPPRSRHSDLDRAGATVNPLPDRGAAAGARPVDLVPEAGAAAATLRLGRVRTAASARRPGGPSSRPPLHRRLRASALNDRGARDLAAPRVRDRGAAGHGRCRCVPDPGQYSFARCARFGAGRRATATGDRTSSPPRDAGSHAARRLRRMAQRSRPGAPGATSWSTATTRATTCSCTCWTVGARPEGPGAHRRAADRQGRLDPPLDWTDLHFEIWPAAGTRTARRRSTRCGPVPGLAA